MTALDLAAWIVDWESDSGVLFSHRLASPTSCPSKAEAKSGSDGTRPTSEQLVAVSEMLPRPEDSWLELDGEGYTSELRIAAVDLTRRGHAKI